MVVCTRFEQEIGRKPGTGERKVPSVPLRSSMEEGEGKSTDAQGGNGNRIVV